LNLVRKQWKAGKGRHYGVDEEDRVLNLDSLTLWGEVLRERGVGLLGHAGKERLAKRGLGVKTEPLGTLLRELAPHLLKSALKLLVKDDDLGVGDGERVHETPLPQVEVDESAATSHLGHPKPGHPVLYNNNNNNKNRKTG